MENKDLQWALEHSRNNGYYPEVFTEETGLDFKIPNHPEFFMMPVEYGKGRIVKICISSYIGYCGGAKHFYASIKANGVHICRKNDEGGVVWCGGAICKEYKEMPKSQTDVASGLWSIDILREITQEDINNDPIRWEGYNVGDMTNAFNDEATCIEYAKEVVKHRFVGNWVVKVELL